MTMRAWAFEGRAGLEVTTPHYRLMTTVRDRPTVDRFCRLMEAAHAEYAALVPPEMADGRPLDVFLFERPDEWETYTRQIGGRDTPVLLSVGAGGYAYGDRFVCWLFNASDLWNVAAHEGFHQYAARHLRQRMPPALEEGLAATFENVAVTDTSIVFDRDNPRRTAGLADAAAKPIALDDLLRMNAGDVAARDLPARERFYGECWALARLLLDAPRYAPGLRRMLADLRDGRAVDNVGRTTAAGLYFPAAARPLLAHYVAPDWPAFVADFETEAPRLGRTSSRRD